LLVVSLGVIAAAAACNASDDAPKVAASSAAPAGRVLEVSGTVTVAGRPLAQNDTVVATSVIDTGADGNVVIELLHNLARWELGPNKHVRVDASLAWREVRRTEPAPEVEHEMSSAGRPAERMAAETAVTAAETETEAGTEGGGNANDKRPLVQAPTAPTTPKAKADSKGTGLGKIGTIGHGAGGGAGQGYGAGAGGVRGSDQTKRATTRAGEPKVTGTVSPAVIKRIVQQHIGRMRLCYERGLAANPRLAGKIVVTFVIDSGGAVSTVQDAGSTIGDAGVVSCVVKAFDTLTFPAPESGVVTVTYPIVFTPGG
jgi:hypothetical protein